MNQKIGILAIAVSVMLSPVAIKVSTAQENAEAVEKAMEQYKQSFGERNRKAQTAATEQLLALGAEDLLVQYLLTHVESPTPSLKGMWGVGDDRGVDGYQLLYRAQSHLGYRARKAVPALLPLARQKDGKLARAWLQEIGIASAVIVPDLDKLIRGTPMTAAKIPDALDAVIMRQRIVGNLDGAGPLLDRVLRSSKVEWHSKIAPVIGDVGCDPELPKFLPALVHHYCFSVATKGQKSPSAFEAMSYLGTIFRQQDSRAINAIARALADNKTLQPNPECLVDLMNIQKVTPELRKAIQLLKDHPSAEVQAVATSLLSRDPGGEPVAITIAVVNRMLSTKNHRELIESLEILQKSKELPAECLPQIASLIEVADDDIAGLGAAILWKMNKSPEALAELVHVAGADRLGPSAEEAAEFLVDHVDNQAEVVRLIESQLRSRLPIPPKPKFGLELSIERLLQIATQYRGEAKLLLPVLGELEQCDSPGIRQKAATARWWISGDVEPALRILSQQLSESRDDKYTTTSAMLSLKMLGPAGRPLLHDVRATFERNDREAGLHCAEWLDKYAGDQGNYRIRWSEWRLRTQPEWENRDVVEMLLKSDADLCKALEAALGERAQFGSNDMRGSAALALARAGLASELIQANKAMLLASVSDYPDSVLAILCHNPNDPDAGAAFERYTSIGGRYARPQLIDRLKYIGPKARFAESFLTKMVESGSPHEKAIASDALSSVRDEPVKTEEDVSQPPRPRRNIFRR